MRYTERERERERERENEKYEAVRRIHENLFLNLIVSL